MLFNSPDEAKKFAIDRVKSNQRLTYSAIQEIEEASLDIRQAFLSGLNEAKESRNIKITNNKDYKNGNRNGRKEETTLYKEKWEIYWFRRSEIYCLGFLIGYLTRKCNKELETLVFSWPISRDKTESVLPGIADILGENADIAYSNNVLAPFLYSGDENEEEKPADHQSKKVKSDHRQNRVNPNLGNASIASSSSSFFSQVDEPGKIDVPADKTTKPPSLKR